MTNPPVTDPASSSSSSISRNTFYNLAGAIIPLATALITVPLYIRWIGESRYGVLAIAWLLLGYFGVFDLGLSRATAQRIARLKSSPFVQRANAFWTALILNCTFGILGAILICPVAYYFFAGHFKIEEILRSEVVSAVPWLVIALPVATVCGVLVGALQGVEKFLVLNAVSAGGSVLFQLLPLLVALAWEPNLSLLLPAAIASRLLTLFALLMLCKKHIFGNSKITYITDEAKQLLSFGGWVTISSFISPVMVMVDRFITGSILGAQAVTFYTVPYQLAERTTILSTALASSLFPRFATLSALESKRIAESALRTLIIVMTPLTVLAMVLAKPFLSIWISVDFAKEAVSVAMLLLAGFWINGMARIPHALLQAKGRPDIVAKCHLVEVVPYLMILYICIRMYGIAGAAFAFSMRLYVDFIILTLASGALKNILLIKSGAMLFIAMSFFIDPISRYASIDRSIAAFLLIVMTSTWSFFHSPVAIKAMFRRFFEKCQFSTRSPDK